VILPCCPFPPLSWYSLAYCSQTPAVIDIHENYVKQSIRNRILLANSQGVWDFTLPVHRRNAESRMIKDVVFTDQMDSAFLLKNIRTAYSSSPFFEHFEDSLSELFKTKGIPGKSLLDFNLATINWIESELGVSRINVSSSYIENSEIDFRSKNAFTNENWSFPAYPQVFEDRNRFIKGRSILDAIFHGGPEVKRWWADVSLRD
jgi:hypothetical protein